WITDFEPNFLSYVEFYEEDFPWRYTPDTPQGAQDRRLTPWLTLLVLKEGEFERNRLPGRPLTSVVLTVADPAALFPPQGQLWAWAHTQLVADIPGGDVPQEAALNATLAARPDAGLSRVVSFRKLDPEAAYYAFLIPTFEVGRKAGLGLPFDGDSASGLELSWSAAGEFPIYHEWFFRTGERGDFEELARRLTPRAVDPRVGIRDMDVGDPGFGVAAAPADSAHRIVGLEGALKSPQTLARPHLPGSTFPGEVAQILNHPADIAADGGDPVVAPPIYGRWHALIERVDPRPQRQGWTDVLNRDARHRAAAGMGAEVIRHNQETFMKKAWEQVGEVLEANRRIALAQAAMQANKKLLAKTFEAGLAPAATVALAGPLVKRVLAEAGTVRAEMAASVVTKATLSGPMRKLTRARGPVERALVPGRVTAATPVAPRLAKLTTELNARDVTAGPQPAKVTVITMENGLEFLAQQSGATPSLPTPVPRPTLPPGPARPIEPRLPTRPTGPFAPRRGAGGGASRFAIPERAEFWSAMRRRTATVPLILRRDNAMSGVVASGGSLAISDGVVDGFGIDVITDSLIVDRFDGIGFSKDKILEAEIAQDFRVTAPPGSAAISDDAPILGAARQLEFQASLAAFSDLLNFAIPDAPARPLLNVEAASKRIIDALQPEQAFRRALDGRISIGSLALDHFGGNLVAMQKPRIIPALACPDFKDPMYAYLTRLGDEYLVPNLGLVPPNTISLMLTNPPFIEAFMAGVNVEFSSELLFREYPTDQRCSAFRQFWDVASIPRPPGVSESEHIAAQKDIVPMHEWVRLGSNSPRDTDGSRVVLVIRGDLLRKYPNTIIYAQSARWGVGDREDELILHDENGDRAAADITDPDIHFPAFKARVSPDLHFIGFNLTLDQVRGHPDLEESAEARRTIPASRLGKYFVLQEVVGEARFGLDVSIPSQSSENLFDNLAWPNIDLRDGPIVDVAKPFLSTPDGDNDNGLVWGANAADMAAILYQKPVMLAVHGRDMLKDI
ncbi:MAG: hypothetical protein GY933_07815, partial [Hyphomicrobiales bacterium]|nr:hypothetical protein [Hyphomicrobiales bacterium]